MFGLEGEAGLGLNIAIVCITVLLAGCMSGLNLAFFSLDINALNGLLSSQSAVVARRAKRILLVLNSPHWLLVTLLIGNAAAVEALPLALDELLGPVLAVPISVILVLLFGEIIPQSVFINNAIPICAFFSYPIFGFMILTSPISLTVGALLDKLVGHREGVFYRRRELREFIELQADMENWETIDYSDAEDGSEEPSSNALSKKELSIMIGALSLSERTVVSCMKTTLELMLCVDGNSRLTKELVQRIFLSGKSRIPVYFGSPANITHYLLTKTTVLHVYTNESDAPLIKDMSLVEAQAISAHDMLGEAYRRLMGGPMHMLVVRDPIQDVTLGIITATDVLEVMHHTKFVDETDVVENRAPMQIIMSQWSASRKSMRASQNVGQRASHHRSSYRSSAAITVPSRASDVPQTGVSKKISSARELNQNLLTPNAKSYGSQL